MNYPLVLKRGILLFWSVWLSVVFASNLADGLQQAHVLPASFKFVSGNLSAIDAAISIYVSSKAIANVLFGLVILIELTGALLFWRAFFDRQSVAAGVHAKLIPPFLVTGGLFAGFLIADEVLIAYERMPGLTTTLFLILCAQLLSVLVISLVGDGARSS